MSEESLDLLLRALADANRRRLLDRLRDHPGLTLGELSAGFSFSRQALSKHLALLEGAELVVTIWRGREKLHYLNPQPLQALPSRWVTATAREHSAALTALQRALQAAAPPAGDAIAEMLAAKPPPATRVRDEAALSIARAYLEGTAQAVRALCTVLAPDAGYERPPAGGFSLAEHLWHLADIETLGWTPRFERALAEKRPRLPGVDGDRQATEKRYQEQPWRGAARRFVSQRRRTLRCLARLEPAWLDKPVVFAGRDSCVGDLLAAMLSHDQEHRAEMARLWATRKENER
jgi:DNA-binding transcriptional ArsR family regulator/uncharacterized damage-inducible protein DinB